MDDQAGGTTADDGYHIYTFQGHPVVQKRIERLHQFQWRPRPTELLSKQEINQVTKNLRKYEKTFGMFVCLFFFLFFFVFFKSHSYICLSSIICVFSNRQTR